MKRSYLFVPGNRPERFAKALACGAGAVILDLEDAVPPEAKADARNAVCDWLRQHENAAWVRINGPDTEFFEADLRALAGVTVPGVMLPKAESPLELGMPVIPLIESARQACGTRSGRARPARRAPRVRLGRFTDAGIQGEDEALLYALAAGARLGASLGLPPIDGVTVHIGDAARLAQDVARARDLGFGAKLCIHPNQIEAVERGLAPTDEERRWAQAVVGAFEQARGNAVRLEGKLIDLPVVERARRLLA